MLHSLGTDDWKTLRVLARAERDAETPAAARVAGWRLRVSPNRRNQDGTYLERMVSAGLLADAGPCDPPGEDEPVTAAVRVPGPFHRYYKLTPLGRHAADYGEYDAPAPNERPLPTVEEAMAARLAARKAAAGLQAPAPAAATAASPAPASPEQPPPRSKRRSAANGRRGRKKK